MGIDWSKACAEATSNSLDVMVTTVYAFGGATVSCAFHFWQIEVAV